MRIILHSDCNNFYVSVECADAPSLRGKPMAVCGDPCERHGIVLAKSEAAKKYGIQTGETVFSARQKCPQLIVLPPSGEKYAAFSRKLQRMYMEYTDLIEPFGLDECWLDVSRSGMDGVEIASRLRQRAKEEFGITLSVGVSFNKVFAKLGSDLHKPDATTVISPGNFREKIWPLPAGDLLFIGHSAAHRLKEYGLSTIGDIVHADPEVLRFILGKNGDTLQAYAAGNDETPVLPLYRQDDIKSIGNSTTPAFDIVDFQDAYRILTVLCDQIAHRMRKHRLRCSAISLSLRDTQLHVSTHQMQLAFPTNLSDALCQSAMQLLQDRWHAAFPLRSLGVQGTHLLQENDGEQLFLLDTPSLQRRAALEKTADQLQAQFGRQALFRGIQLRPSAG